MKHLSRLVFFALITSSLLAVVGCGEGDTAAAPAHQGPHVQLNDVDFMINDYEKAAIAFSKTVKKFKGGDVSLTMRYIDDGKAIRTWQAKLQQAASRMTPAQEERVAAISAKVTPDLPN